MTTSTERFPPRTELSKKLLAKAYRREFVHSRIQRGVPLQIRAMREAKRWNQKELGDAAGIPQANVSRIENTRDTFLSFPTLLKIAEAFDVALIVKFAAFSELEELASRTVADLIAPDHATDEASRVAWEVGQVAKAADTPLTKMEDYLSRVYLQGSYDMQAESSQGSGLGGRKGPKKAGGSYGIADGAKGGHVSLSPLGANEPKAQGAR